jgi:hypothetical protein
MEKRWMLLLLVVGLINTNLLFAQRDERRKAEFDRFKEKRVEFISQAMNLNADEAKAFWPLCNELQEKKFELNRQMRRAVGEFMKSEKEGKTHTESEYKEIVDIVAQFKVKDAQLDAEYLAKFIKVISYEKIFRYQQAEQQFARQMLNQRGDGRGLENQKKR